MSGKKTTNHFGELEKSTHISKIKMCIPERSRYYRDETNIDSKLVAYAYHIHSFCPLSLADHTKTNVLT